MRHSVPHSLRQIAEHVHGRLLDPAHADLPIDEVHGLSNANAASLSYVEDARHLESAMASPARALLVPDRVETLDRPAIAVRNPRRAFAQALGLLHPPALPAPQIHPTADIDPTAQVDPSASVGPHCAIGPRARIGPRAVLHAHVRVGCESVIGAATELRPRVVVGVRVSIGASCLIHANTTIGDDRPTGATASLSVEIGDHVEVGGRARIEGGRAATTRIGEGTRCDNMVAVGHDAQVGAHCLMVSTSHVGAGATLEHHVTLAGQAMVLAGAHVSERAIVASRGKVDRRVEPGLLVSGDPAVSHRDELRRVANTMKLARLAARIDHVLSRADGAQ